MGTTAQACGNWARTKAAYRLFDHPRTQMRQVLNSHDQATAARVADHPVVLVVPHSTSHNYSAPPLTEGLGPLNTRADNSIGLWLRDTLAFSPAGIPLGLVDVELWARDPPAQGRRITRHNRPIEWMLLTDVVHTLAQARERLQWYVTRWQIESYHRNLKSGCRLEQHQASGGLPGHRPGGGLAHLPLGQARPRTPRYPLFEQA